MIAHEQKTARELLDAMEAANASLHSQGQKSSAWCIERAMDELDTAAAVEIARMFKRNLKA